MAEMRLRPKEEYTLYNGDGKPFMFNHLIDVRDALSTGNYFEEPPKAKKAARPMADEGLEDSAGVVDPSTLERGKGRPARKPPVRSAKTGRFEIREAGPEDGDGHGDGTEGS